MKLNDLKKELNKLTTAELEQNLIYNSDDLCISGIVTGFKKAKSNLYNTGEVDPTRLFTKSRLQEEGYDDDDINGMDIEVVKGQWVIEL